MTTTTAKMTFEDFLNYDDGSDYLYELENGELVQVPSESDLNQRIASLLFALALQAGIPPYRIRMGIELVTTGVRTSVRIPDLAILSEELADIMKGSRRSLILMEMPPPQLVVEVVSPNQEKRDYRYKRSEYAARGIQEYWIVDPMAQKLTLLEWVEGLYEEKIYAGEQPIYSPLLGSLDLTVNQLLAG